MTVLAGNFVSASYPALHALVFGQQKTILAQHSSELPINVEPKLALTEKGINSKTSVSSSEDYDAHPQYSFSYDVKDTTTGDDKAQEEKRDGDVVQGQVKYFMNNYQTL